MSYIEAEGLRKVYDPGGKAVEALRDISFSVKEGEYLLAVNGRTLAAADDVSAWLEGTAGKRTSIRVGPDPSGAAAWKTSRRVD